MVLISVAETEACGLHSLLPAVRMNICPKVATGRIPSYYPDSAI